MYGLLPISTYAASELTARLWRIPETRALYVKRLQELMDSLWDESALNAEVDRMGRLSSTPTEHLEVIKQFIDERQALIEAELASNSIPDWPEETRDYELICTEPPATSGTFELVWSDTHNFTPDGKFTFDISIAGQAQTITGELLSAAGPVQEIDDMMYGMPRIAFMGTDDTGERTIWVGLYIPDSEWREGEIAFHGWEIFGIVLELLPTHIETLGMIGDGTITMEKAGHTDGAAVKGSWQGQVATHPALLF